MGCTHEWGLLLSRYVDQGLAPDEHAQVEEHLAACAPCRDLLSLFRRNDSVLDNALAGEAFGSQMVESVMAEVRARETPPVIAPEVRTGPAARAIAWLGAHGWKAAAAAMVTLSLAAAAVQIAETRRLGGLVADFSERNQQLAASLEEVRASAGSTNSDLAERLSELVLEVQANRAALQTPPDQTYGIVLPRRGIEVGIRVRDASLFKAYDLERSEHGQGKWTTIATDLQMPSYLDSQVVPGVHYDYRFTGRRRDGTLDDPMPPAIRLRLPESDGSDPETHVDVHFIAATPSRDQATFRLVRWIGGVEHQHLVTVKPNGMIGEKILVGDREVDFTTGLRLDQLVDADQVVSFTVGDRQQAFARSNVRADLRRAETRSAPFQVWRGSATWVPAAR